MKRKLQKFFAVLLSLCFVMTFSVSAMADENDYSETELLEMLEPITLSEEQNSISESTRYARNTLQFGSSFISIYGSKKLTAGATTSANKICSLIKNEVYVFRYYPLTDDAVLIGGPYRFATVNRSSCSGDVLQSVASTGYYFTMAIHTIENETCTSQTDAIHLTY